MILAIRKPIARFMRYVFGRQYVFVLAKSGKTKLRRVFTSDWDGEGYVHDDDIFPFVGARVPLHNARGGTFQDWKPATFTEAERKANAVLDAMTEAQATNSKPKNGGAVPTPRLSAADLAAFQAAFQASFAKATQPKPPRP